MLTVINFFKYGFLKSESEGRRFRGIVVNEFWGLIIINTLRLDLD